VVAVLFLVPALTLAGVPLFAGFVPKLGLIEAGFDQGQYAIVVVSLVISLLTLLSMMKIWIGAFWSPVIDAPEHGGHRVGPLGGPVLMIGPTVALALVSVGIAVAAGPLYELCQRAATDLLDPARYVDAVLGT